MKKRVRSLLTLLLCLCMLLPALSGCGKEKSGPVTITIWHDKEEAVAETLQANL